MFEWVLKTPMINIDSVVTLKLMLSFKLLSFDFSLKETRALLTMLVKTIYCKAENDIGKCYHWCSQFQQFQLPGVFNFHADNIEYLQVLVVQRRFCQQQKNSSAMASLYIYKLKINAKLQGKTLATWDMSIYHVPTVRCINRWSQNFCF